MLSHTKDNYSGNIGAPLWVWITASAVALIFLVITFLGFSQSEYLDYFNPKRLERFAIPGEEKSLKVAVIGTSLVESAFPKDESMEKFARDHGRKIRFLRFSRRRGVLNEYYDIAEAVIKSSADIIFFEAAVFSLDQKFTGKGKLGFHREGLRAGLKTLLPDLPFVPERFRLQKNFNYTDTSPKFSPEKQSEQKFEQYLKRAADSRIDDFREGAKHNYIDTPLELSPEKQSRYIKRAANFRIRDFREGANFANLFALARQQGKIVVFLDLSRSKEAWDLLPPTFEGELEKTIGRYTEVYGIPYLRFPYRLPLDYFQDFNHYGPKGQKFYSEWFLSNLTSLSGDAGK